MKENGQFKKRRMGRIHRRVMGILDSLFRDDRECKRKTKLEGSAWQNFRVCECCGERWFQLSLLKKGIQENILTSA